MNVQFACNGADFPVLGVKATANLHVGFWADHRSSLLKARDFVGRDRRNGRVRPQTSAAQEGRMGLSGGLRHAGKASVGERRRSRQRAPDPTSHDRHFARRGDRKRNLDPSRGHGFVGDSGTPAAGRDGRVVLPDSAGGGSWRGGAARAGLGAAGWDCNSVVRGHSAGRSRTPRGTRRGKPVDEEPPRHDAPCAPPGGAGQRRPIMAG